MKTKAVRLYGKSDLRLEEFDLLEPIDLEMLRNPHRDILDPGGQIFFALAGDAVVGTCGLQWVSPGVYEIIKLGVRPEFRGRGAGQQLLERCLSWAREQKAEKVVLYSNSRLQSALGCMCAAAFPGFPSYPVITPCPTWKWNGFCRNFPP